MNASEALLSVAPGQGWEGMPMSYNRIHIQDGGSEQGAENQAFTGYQGENMCGKGWPDKCLGHEAAMPGLTAIQELRGCRGGGG